MRTLLIILSVIAACPTLAAAQSDLKNPFDAKQRTALAGQPSDDLGDPATPDGVQPSRAPVSQGRNAGQRGIVASNTKPTGLAAPESAATNEVPAGGSAAAVAPVPAPAVARELTVDEPAARRTPAELRKICADAMNADATFAEAIAKTVNEETLRQHLNAGKAIAKNERHVILAYAAMWLVAAGFVLFLWRRQQGLKIEIERLRRDLDKAAAP